MIDEMRRAYNQKYYLENKDYVLKMSAKWRNEHRKQYLAIAARYHRQFMENRYNVIYPKIIECEMCDKIISDGKIHLDHDHKSGLFRGWLCGRCNTALGTYEKYKENAERYLKNHA